MSGRLLTLLDFSDPLCCRGRRLREGLLRTRQRLLQPVPPRSGCPPTGWRTRLFLFLFLLLFLREGDSGWWFWRETRRY